MTSSAAEEELGALFINLTEAHIMKLTLVELGHPYPSTPIHCDNATSTGIVNGIVKKQQAISMEMRYFYVYDKVKHGVVDFMWHPGQENFGYYTSKNHGMPHQKSVRLYFLQERNSPRILPRAPNMSSLQGCVGNIPGGYIRGRSMPVKPRNIDRLGKDYTWNRGSTRKPTKQ